MHGSSTIRALQLAVSQYFLRRRLICDQATQALNGPCLLPTLCAIFHTTHCVQSYWPIPTARLTTRIGLKPPSAPSGLEHSLVPPKDGYCHNIFCSPRQVPSCAYNEKEHSSLFHVGLFGLLFTEAG